MKIFEHVNTIVSRVKPRLVVSMMILSISSATVFTSQLANAAVYKKVDADGNVSFSDVPDKNAQLINVAPLTTVPSMNPDLIASTLEVDSKARIEKYTLTIVSPTPDQTYRRAVDVFSANVQVKPSLKNGDRLITLVDGKPANSGSTAEMDRGQHQFEAQILNDNGRILLSKSVTFNVLQGSVKQQAAIGKKK